MILAETTATTTSRPARNPGDEHACSPRSARRLAELALPLWKDGRPSVLVEVETCALAAIVDGGYSLGDIVVLYPYLTAAQIQQAIELEQQLATNLAVPAAA